MVSDSALQCTHPLWPLLVPHCHWRTLQCRLFLRFRFLRLTTLSCAGVCFSFLHQQILLPLLSVANFDFKLLKTGKNGRFLFLYFLSVTGRLSFAALLRLNLMIYLMFSTHSYYSYSLSSLFLSFLFIVILQHSVCGQRPCSLQL